MVRKKIFYWIVSIQNLSFIKKSWYKFMTLDWLVDGIPNSTKSKADYGQDDYFYSYKNPWLGMS